MLSFQSDRYHLRGVMNSLQGGRPENQDSVGSIETALGWLLVLCDGMGGGPGGKTASDLVKHVCADHIATCNEQSDPATALKEAIYKAEQALEQRMCAEPSLQGMGSTVVLLLINAEAAYVAHAGDSRCYRLSDGKIRFRTADHSLVGELVRKGVLTEEQARTSPQSNIITRGLGNTSNHAPEISVIPFRAGDRFVVCTDGVWGSMNEKDLLVRLTAPGSPDTIVERLGEEVDQIGFASGGGHDNHTLAMVLVTSHSKLEDRMEKKYKWALLTTFVLLVVSIVLNIISCHELNKRGQTSSQSPYASGYTIPSSVDDMDEPCRPQEPPAEPSAPRGPGGINIDSLQAAMKKKNAPKDTAKANERPSEGKLTPLDSIRNEILGLLDSIKTERITMKDKSIKSKQAKLALVEDNLSKLLTSLPGSTSLEEALQFVQKNKKKMTSVARSGEGAPFVTTKEANETIDELKNIIIDGKKQ